MGGDYAPQAVVSGAVLAAGLIAPQSKIVLFGDRPSIEELLAKENFRADAFDIVHTTQVIEMGDNPALTFRQKPDSSIAVGFRHLTEGRIDGFASAGSTGAMMVGCMYTVKQIEGIIRPAISSVIPTIDGGSVMLLDVGLNVDWRCCISTPSSVTCTPKAFWARRSPVSHCSTSARKRRKATCRPKPPTN